jgi:hypothetical protein
MLQLLPGNTVAGGRGPLLNVRAGRVPRASVFERGVLLLQSQPDDHRAVRASSSLLVSSQKSPRLSAEQALHRDCSWSWTSAQSHASRRPVDQLENDWLRAVSMEP